MKVKVQARLTKNFTGKALEKTSKGIKLFEHSIVSGDLAHEIMKFRAPYKGSTGFHHDGKGRREIHGADIIRILETGAETLIPIKDGEFDIFLDVGHSTALGYTYPNVSWQWISKWWLELGTTTPSDIAMNIFHELLHKYAWDHAFMPHKLRAYTVCYAGGYIVRDLTKKY